MQEGSELDDKRLDKPVRLTQREKKKHVFYEGDSTKLIDEAIIAHRDFLEERMEPDFGLLDKLLATGTLYRKDIAEVKDKSPFHKRNSQLLDYILEKHQGDSLIDALRDTEQKHIVNYLNGNGEYNSEYREEWPLMQREISILNSNQGSMIDLLELSDLLGLLYSSKVINRRQLNFISSKPNSDSKSEALLDILQRRSLHDYTLMISCLHQSNQSHIARVLESGGVVVRVKARLDGPVETVEPIEEEIVARITTALTGLSIEKTSRIMERVQLNVIAAKKGHSILLYIWCETVEYLFCLYELLASGRLKYSVQRVFNHLPTLSQLVAVKDITLNDDEFQHMKSCLSRIESVHLGVKREEVEAKMKDMVSSTTSEVTGKLFELAENPSTILSTVDIASSTVSTVKEATIDIASSTVSAVTGATVNIASLTVSAVTKATVTMASSTWSAVKRVTLLAVKLLLAVKPLLIAVKRYLLAVGKDRFVILLLFFGCVAASLLFHVVLDSYLTLEVIVTIDLVMAVIVAVTPAVNKCIEVYLQAAFKLITDVKDSPWSYVFKWFLEYILKPLPVPLKASLLEFCDATKWISTSILETVPNQLNVSLSNVWGDEGPTASSSHMPQLSGGTFMAGFFIGRFFNVHIQLTYYLAETSILLFVFDVSLYFVRYYIISALLMSFILLIFDKLHSLLHRNKLKFS